MITTIFIIFQIAMSFYFIYPFLLKLISFMIRNEKVQHQKLDEVDYAVIVTAYEQTTLIPNVVSSILKLNYHNYLIYVVADKCDISALSFDDPRVVLLRPVEVLGSNTKSHFYAIDNFIRNHERLTIIDSDNLVDPNYLIELNSAFDQGFQAVQGVRRAKNLNTQYACLDEAGDIFYRYIDRKLLFAAGSSATLAGSGMAFTTSLYKECLANRPVDGAGFDKVLQYEILKRGYRIAFLENAIVYDEKTAKSDQLVKQRARWINTWFKYAKFGASLLWSGIVNFNLNSVLFGLMLLRPPLFILFVLVAISGFINLFVLPMMIIYLVLSFFLFLYFFYLALSYFKADDKIYKSLIDYPKFFYLQLIALYKSKRANELSVATKHSIEVKEQE